MKGVLAENDQLPSVRALAKDLGLNPNTVSKAYQELERNGIIYSVSGRGSFVSPLNGSGLHDTILEDFDNAVKEAVKAGITAEQLKRRIDEVTADDKDK